MVSVHGSHLEAGRRTSHSISDLTTGRLSARPLRTLGEAAITSPLTTTVAGAVLAANVTVVTSDTMLIGLTIVGVGATHITVTTRTGRIMAIERITDTMRTGRIMAIERITDTMRTGRIMAIERITDTMRTGRIMAIERITDTTRTGRIIATEGIADTIAIMPATVRKVEGTVGIMPVHTQHGKTKGDSIIGVIWL